MAAITWRNQVAPSFADSVAAQRTATQAFDNAFNQMSGATNYFRDRNIADYEKQGESNQLDWLNQANQFTNRDTLAQDLAGIALPENGNIDKNKIAEYMLQQPGRLRQKEQDIFTLDNLSREAGIQKNVDNSGTFFAEHTNKDGTINDATGLSAWMAMPGHTQAGYDQGSSLYDKNTGVLDRAAAAKAALAQGNIDRTFNLNNKKAEKAAYESERNYQYKVAKFQTEADQAKLNSGYANLNEQLLSIGGGFGLTDEAAQAQASTLAAQARTAGIDSGEFTQILFKGNNTEFFGGRPKISPTAAADLAAYIADPKKNPRYVSPLEKLLYPGSQPITGSQDTTTTNNQGDTTVDPNTIEGAVEAARNQIKNNQNQTVNSDSNTVSEQEQVEIARAKSVQEKQTPAQAAAKQRFKDTYYSKPATKRTRGNVSGPGYTPPDLIQQFKDIEFPLTNTLKGGSRGRRGGSSNTENGIDQMTSFLKNRYRTDGHLKYIKDFNGNPIYPSKSKVEKQQEQTIFNALQSMDKRNLNAASIFDLVTSITGKKPTTKEVYDLLNMAQ